MKDNFHVPTRKEIIEKRIHPVENPDTITLFNGEIIGQELIDIDGAMYGGNAPHFTYTITSFDGETIEIVSQTGDKRTVDVNPEFYQKFSFRDGSLERTRLAVTENRLLQLMQGHINENFQHRDEYWKTKAQLKEAERQRYEFSRQQMGLDYMQITEDSVRFNGTKKDITSFLRQVGDMRKALLKRNRKRPETQNTAIRDGGQPILDLLRNYFNNAANHLENDIAVETNWLEQHTFLTPDARRGRQSKIDELEKRKEDLELVVSRIRAIEMGIHKDYDFDMFSNSARKPGISIQPSNRFKYSVLWGLLGAAIAFPFLSLSGLNYEYETLLSRLNFGDIVSGQHYLVALNGYTTPDQIFTAYSKRINDSLDENIRAMINNGKEEEKERMMAYNLPPNKLRKRGSKLRPTIRDAYSPDDVIIKTSIKKETYWKLDDYDTFNGTEWSTSGAISPEDDLYWDHDIKEFLYGFSSEEYSLDDFFAVLRTTWLSDDQDINLDQESYRRYTEQINISIPRGIETQIIEITERYSSPKDGSIDSIDDAKEYIKKEYGSIWNFTHLVKNIKEEIENYFTGVFVDKELREAYEKSDDILRTLVEKGVGDCDIVNSYFIAILRELGIPARLAGGFYTTDGVITENNLHAWAEVFIPDGGWRIYDASPPQETERLCLNSTSAEERYRELLERITQGDSTKESEIDSKKYSFLFDEYIMLADVIKAGSVDKVQDRLYRFSEVFRREFYPDCTADADEQPFYEQKEKAVQKLIEDLEQEQDP